MYQLPDNTIVQAGHSFTIGAGDDTVSFPANWLEHATQYDLDRYGISVVPDPAPPAPDLGQVKADKLSELETACRAQIYAGFQSSALGTVHTYPANDRDQVNLSASVLASLLPGIPPEWITPFWCMDSSGAWGFVPHTAAQIQQVGVEAKAAVLSALQNNATLAGQVMAVQVVGGDVESAIAAVQAISW